MAKKKIGDLVTIDGQEKVIIGMMEQLAHNGKMEKKSKKKLRPQPKGKADSEKTHQWEEPVLEKTLGYFVQDPDLPWQKSNSTWIRATEIK